MNYTEIIKSKFDNTIRKYGMIDGAVSVLCGFSGGADSTALLHLLRIRCREQGIRLAAVHINHMIRGGEADRDMQHCIGFCRDNDIELFVRSVNIPEIAAAGKMGTEEAARRERYRIFSQICSAGGFSVTAVAHNAGDNFETVLFNMLRGTGIRGLCGIPPVRNSVIRPLIECSRDEIVGYCNENKLPYVNDSTNSDIYYTRNFIRREIIPLMKHVNSGAEENVTRMCSELRRDSDFLDELSEKSDCDSDALLSRRIMRQYTAFTGGRTLEHVHVEEVMKLLREGRLHGSVSLPGKAAVRKTRSGFVFERDDKIKTAPGYFSVPLKKGISDLGRSGIIGLFDSADEMAKDIKEIKNIYKLFIQVTLYSDKINGGLYIRNRLGGDSIRCGGMNRSVKKLLCEKKVPLEERGLLPFVCDGSGLLWIPGIAVRDGAEAPKDTEEKNKLFYVFYANK